MRDELKRVISSSNFWQALGNNSSKASCCGHDHGEEHFHMEGNFLIAQKAVSQAIDIVFGDDFDNTDPQHHDSLTIIAAIQKAQDQLSGRDNFVSKRTEDFNEHFNIVESLHGTQIAEEVLAMPDAKKFLVKKFDLSNTRAKANVILESRENALEKAGQIVDLVFKDAVDPLVEAAGSVYKATPSLGMIALGLGTAQLVLRACDYQESANHLRDNIGAATEAGSFFVLVNGVLENFSHSFILAAPAIASVAAYDKGLKPIYDYCLQKRSSSTIDHHHDHNHDHHHDHHHHDIESNTINTGSFEINEHDKTVQLLKKAESLINEDEMWIGLRKHQLAYQDNNLETVLKDGIHHLITELEDDPTQMNSLLQSGFQQTLRDSFEMLRTYAQIYEKKNPAHGVSKFIDEFCDHFARDALLLIEPSKDVKMAAFCCRLYEGLVTFEERIRESLPHMPTGQQVLMAASVIGGLYASSEIYQSITGQKEEYSDYVTNFPDHLFEWLQLDQMYDNLGGGAAMTEYFKDFFAKFNLAENSTHLGIAAAPFAVYSKMGSKMFDGMTHTPLNYLAYAADLTSSYISSTKETMAGWFGNNYASPPTRQNTTEIEIIEEDLKSIDDQTINHDPSNKPNNNSLEMTKKLASINDLDIYL